MNLAKLFEMQRELDERIEKEHPRQPNENRLSKKILALQVELGELANEWRGFKFWSSDQEPRTRVYLTNYTEQDSVLGPGAQWKNPLLEEYVDCLHFILSIGLEIGVTPEEVETEPYHCASITEQFIDTFWYVSQFRYEERNGRLYEDYLAYDDLISHFIGLGEMLGFTWEQIEQAYIEKNKVNHERQEQGY